jgi:hypothetical protein
MDELKELNAAIRDAGALSGKILSDKEVAMARDMISDILKESLKDPKIRKYKEEYEKALKEQDGNKD